MPLGKFSEEELNMPFSERLKQQQEAAGRMQDILDEYGFNCVEICGICEHLKIKAHEQTATHLPPMRL